MTVNIIAGRVGYGKTSKALDLAIKEAQKNNDKPIVFLVPEKYTYEMQKKLSEKLIDNDDKNMRLNILSFTSLSEDVFSFTEGLIDTKLNDSGRSMITLRAIDKQAKNLKLYKNASSKLGIMEKILDSINEFKKFNILPEQIEEISLNTKDDDENLCLKLEEISKIYKSYDEILHKSFLDNEDYMHKLINNIDDYSELNDATVFFDEFTVFTPNQFEVIKKIIKKAKDVYISLTVDANTVYRETGLFSKTNYVYKNIIDYCKEENVEYKTYALENKSVKSREILHLEKNYPNITVEKYTENVENITVRAFSNNYKEIQYLASEITNLIKRDGYRYRDITVVSRNIEDYSYIIESIFSNYGIKYFIDGNVSANLNPIITLILSVLEMKNRGYTYESMFRYFKCGLLEVDNYKISQLENFVIENGISGKKWFKDFDRKVNYNVDLTDDDKEEDKIYIKEINEIRKELINPVQKLDENLGKDNKGGNKAKNICKYLYEFLEDINLFNTVETISEKFIDEGKLSLAMEYTQLIGLIVDIIDQIYEIMGESRISLEKFVAILNTGMSKADIGLVPPTIDQVMVTSVDRLKSSNTKHLYIIGANDGVFPMLIKDDSFFDDAQRKIISSKGYEMDSNSINRIYDEQFLIYTTLAATAEKLNIFYPIADIDGVSKNPSSVLRKLKKIFPKLETKMHLNDMDILDSYKVENSYALNEIYTNMLKAIKYISQNDLLNVIIDEKSEEKQKLLNEKVNYWVDVLVFFANNEKYRDETIKSLNAIIYKNQPKQIDKVDIPKLYKGSMLSISKLEKFVSCPFSYFLKYGLKAEPRREYSFSALDSGSYVHKILDKFSKKLNMDNLKWRDISNEYIDQNVDAISETLVENIPGYILKNSPKYRVVSKRVSDMLKFSLRIVKFQIESGDFEPKGFEVEFGMNGDYSPISVVLNNGRKLYITGKIDRVDEYNTDKAKYIRIIDYKSSDKDIDLNDVYEGISLQLFVYMNAMLSNLNKELAEKLGLDDKQLYKIINNQETYVHKEKLIFENSIYKVAMPAAMFYNKIDNSKIDLTVFDEEKIKELIKDNNKLKGIIVSDDTHIAIKMDRDLEEKYKKSIVIDATLKKDGNFNSTTIKKHVVKEEQFEIIRKYIENKVKDICENIYSGNIEIKPFKKGLKTPCEYCDYGGVCRFDEKIYGNEYRKIKKYEEPIKKMREVVENIENGGDKDGDK